MFIYLAAKRFPSSTADHIYIRFFARALSTISGESFRLLIHGEPSAELEGIKTTSVYAPARLRTLFYFLWLPIFLVRKRYLSRNFVFFSNDLRLLTLLIFWKRMLGGTFRIYSDWHLLSETWMDRFVAKGSDGCVTTSERLKDLLIARTSVPSDTVHVLYGGIQLEEYDKPHPLQQELSDSSLRYVGYIGFFTTLGREKGIVTMLEALRLLSEDIVMVFVGGTSEEIARYAALSHELGVGERCRWIGRKPFEDVVSYEQNMDALVIPYPNEPHFRDYGFPMKVYEYLAAGVPIVYSNLEIMEEILGGSAESFTPSDAHSLATAIDAALRPDAAERAVKNIETARGYSWGAKAMALVALVGEDTF